MPRLFVYGDLRKYGDAHSEIKGARYLGKSSAVGYAVEEADHGGRGMYQTGDESTVEGELYHVTQSILDRLDKFEDAMFHRRVVATDGGRAWAYVLASKGENE